MVASNSNGSQTCTISTEHTLATITSAGVYQLWLDTNALAADDVLEVRQYVKVDGTNSRLVDMWTVGPLVKTSKAFDPYPVAITTEIKYTITQTAGTGRAIPWRVLQIDG